MRGAGAVPFLYLIIRSVVNCRDSRQRLLELSWRDDGSGDKGIEDVRMLNVR